MIKINIYGSDAIIGDFQLSNYGLMLASFEGTNSSDIELGMKSDTIEEFIGNSPIPKFIGESFSSKLTFTATIIKNPHININNNEKYFTEHECREVLRQLTGFHGYKKMQLLSYELDEPLFFNIRVVNVKYQRIGTKIAGIILDMECDSQFAWSNNFSYSFNASPSSNVILFNNSDDIYNYLLPKIVIKTLSNIQTFSITNISDNNWTTTIKSLSKNEIITMDSYYSTLTSSIANKIISNNFNMHFIRLIPGKNEFSVSHNVDITFSYKLPRKVGFI